MAKFRLFPSILIAGAICCVGAGTAVAQATLSCVANGAVNVPMRAEGLAELAGDFIITCTGGVTTAAGLPVPAVDIRIFLNTAVTSRKLSGSWSEALLLIDEPVPAAQRVCGTSGDVEPNDGVCTITGTGTGAGVYIGAAGRPNVFQGFQDASNEIRWTGVPIDPPGASGTRVIRITNLRANANALGVSGNNQPPVTVNATAIGTPFNYLPINGPATQFVGSVQRGISFSVNTFKTFAQCTSENAALAADPNSSGASQFSLHFSELFGTAFKKRNTGTTDTNPNALADQNNLSVGTYNSESGFYNGSFPALPNRGSLGLAGLADQGTRLMAQFYNLPPGVSLFSQVSVTASSGAPDVVRMVNAGVSGSGPYAPVTANSFGIAAIPIVNLAATAVYEFVGASATTLATVDIPIYVAYISNVPSNLPGVNTANVRGSYGPISTVNAASDTAPVPRFADTSTASNAFAIAPCTCASFASNSGSFGAAGGAGSVVVNATDNSCFWTPFPSDTWITIVPPGPRLGAATLNFSVAANNSPIPRMGTIQLPEQIFSITQQGGTCTLTISSLSQSFGFAGGTGSFNVTANFSACPWTTSPSDNWITITNPGPKQGSGVVNFSIAPNSGTQRSGSIGGFNQTFSVAQGGSPSLGLRFVPLTPCRIMDTRGVVPTPPWGGHALPAGGTRDLQPAHGVCNGIPDNAAAFSLNVTVVPAGPLAFLTIWPTGQQRPPVSTLNSFDGRIKANAAIVPAGDFGQVTMYATDVTDVIVDINGYFIPFATGDLTFHPVTPCRVADTRNPAGPFGGPAMTAALTRSFSPQSSGCGIPANAQAYSLNMTVVPPGPMSFLTTWPAGQTQPLASTLNALTGTVTANAAIVPAGTGGAINVYVYNPTDLIIDINGYFAPPGSPGELLFYPVNPCRISDTRDPAGPFGAPAMTSGQTRAFSPVSSRCALPTTAKAYSLNATVVPSGLLGFLALWPTGQLQPFVSTLNSFDGVVASNAAIVPAGTAGSVSAYVTHPTELILDVNGYFAP